MHGAILRIVRLLAAKPRLAIRAPYQGAKARLAIHRFVIYTHIVALCFRITHM